MQDDQTRLEAAEDTRSLVGGIFVDPGTDRAGDLGLEGDLAGILTLAANRKTPTDPEDGRVLPTMVAGACNRRQTQGLFQAAA